MDTSIDTQLSDQHGLPAAAIRAIREQLPPGSQKKKGRGRRVELTPEGLTALEAAIEAEKKEEAALGEPVPLVVVAICTNRTWVRVQVPPPLRETTVVRVRNSDGIQPRSRLSCAKDKAGKWHCVDPRRSVPVK